METLPLAQHDLEIQHNRMAWERKPLLRTIYLDFYTQILASLRKDIPGDVVELGSGIGNFKSVYPKAITTDIFPNPWIDRVENAYHLSFHDGTVSNLVLFDVFHHLQYPGQACEEIKRVLVPKGRVIIFEPYISLLGLIVYGLVHHEPIALSRKISWIPTDSANFEENYYAAQGNATRLFGIGSPYKDEIEKEWRLISKKKFSALSYILSGGFSKPALYPPSLLRVVRSIEYIFNLFPLLFATRMLIVLEKK